MKLRRIETAFARLTKQGRKAMIPYIVAGDPAPGVTVPLMHALVAAGADVIELGVPFSDPMAEGPVIQLAHERALQHRVSLTDILVMVRDFRRADGVTPIVLMGYANPVVVMGYAQFAAAAAAAGVDALLTVDMPPEEGVALQAQLDAVGIDTIYLIAPTTTRQRMQTICDSAGGYIYYVSLKGVTGAGNLDTAEVSQRIQAIRECTQLPVCVGFGIKDGESARQIARDADGVVIGSALVQQLATLAANGKLDSSNLGSATSLLAEIRQALDKS